MPLKASDLRELSAEELKTKAEEHRQKLYQLRVQAAHKELEKGTEIRVVRRDLARVITVLNQKKAAPETKK